jgi:hypothetical protein
MDGVIGVLVDPRIWRPKELKTWKQVGDQTAGQITNVRAAIY